MNVSRAAIATTKPQHILHNDVARHLPSAPSEADGDSLWLFYQ